VLVNGEVVVNLNNTNQSYVQYKLIGSSNKLTQNVTGLTYTDVLALPSKARVSICYAGEVGSEGFMGLKKL